MIISGITQNFGCLLDKTMFKLSDFFTKVIREGEFLQTQFSNTEMSDSICYVAREQFLNQANKNPRISCVIVPDGLADKVSPQKGLVVADRPEQVFYQLHNDLYQKYSMHPDMQFGRGEEVTIHPSAIISERTYIGSRVIIGAGVIIEDYCHIDDDVIVESGAIIGSSGHYYKTYNNSLFRVEHAGGVWLDKGVQILAGAVVSKSLHADFTKVGKETVISIKAHVGHGCQIGQRCTLTGNVQVSGFTTIGDDVWIGPSATIGNLLTIGDKSRIEIGSVVIKGLPVGSRVSGNFAWNHRANLRNYTKKVNDK